MALPQRVELPKPEPADESVRSLRRQNAKRATVPPLGLGMIAAGLVIAGTIWSWGGYGWLNHGSYRVGTNGGGVSEPLGLASDDPSDFVRNPLGNTANPNTGVRGQPDADGDILTGDPNATAENPASSGANGNEDRDGRATEPAPADAGNLPEI